MVAIIRNKRAALVVSLLGAMALGLCGLVQVEAGDVRAPRGEKVGATIARAPAGSGSRDTETPHAATNMTSPSTATVPNDTRSLSVADRKAAAPPVEAGTGTGLFPTGERGGLPGCFCGTDTENRSFCFNDLECTVVTACRSSTDCPSGYRCLANNCCTAPLDFACFPECPSSLACTAGSTCSAGYQPCTNDLCQDAPLLSVPGFATGDTTQATLDNAPFCGTGNAGPGVWYKVIGTGNTMTASTCSEFNSNPDTKISVYCSGCSALNCVAGNDDNCTSFSSLLSTVSWCSQLGREYLILVHDFSASSGGGAFTLNVWDDGTTCNNPPQCDQTCVGQGSINCGDIVSGDTAQYSDTIDLYNCSTWDESGPEAVFTFTPTADSQVTAALSNLQNNDLDVFILTGQCANNTCVASGNTSATFDATASTTYFIVVDGYQGAAGPFTLTVTCTPVAQLGACCDGSTWICSDGIDSANCQPPARFAAGTLCSSLNPPCTPPPPTGACCVANTCTGTKPEGDCVFESGVWFDGKDCASFTCPPPPTCPSNTLYGQVPHLPSDAWSFGVSDTDWTGDTNTGALRYESFPTLNAPICDVHWWGINYNSAFASCVEDPMTFNIKFYDNAAAASTPGTEVCTYTVSTTGTPTGWGFLSPNDLNEYDVELPTCCPLSTGWVSIQGTGGGPDCWFWWASSPDGDGKACFETGTTLDCSGTTPDTQYDLSVCLTGATTPPEACCLPDGLCEDLSAQACRARNGIRQPPDTTCGQFVCPPVEVDVFPFSVGSVELSGSLGNEVIAVHGPATAHVFFEGANEGNANDDDGNGLEEVITEMVQMELTGSSPTLGPVMISLHPTIRSMGEIEETVNNTSGMLDVPPFTATGTADSFFDMFFEVDLPDLGRQLFTRVPKRMSATIDNKPPGPGTAYQNFDRTELFDANGNPTGVFLSVVRHVPSPVCVLGDVNDDGFWTLQDYVAFAACIAGPMSGPLNADCVRCFDYDNDQDIDVWDFGRFQRQFTGSPGP